MILYKWLTAEGNAPIGNGQWRKGRWRSVRGAHRAAAFTAYAAKATVSSARQNARLLQYVKHGLAAMDMPWPVEDAA